MSQSFVHSNVESNPDLPSSRPGYCGSKRAACDRCRGQKLRCLSNESNSDTCARCAKAGAICSFSVSKRASRAAGTNSKNHLEERNGQEVAEASLKRQVHGSQRSNRKAVHQEHHYQPTTRINGSTVQSGATIPDGEINGTTRHTLSANKQSSPSYSLNTFSVHETTSGPSDEHIGFPSYLESSNPTLTQAEDDLAAFLNDQGPADLDSFVYDRKWPLPQVHMQDFADDYPMLPLTHGERRMQISGISEDVEALSSSSSHTWRTEVSGKTPEQSRSNAMSRPQLGYMKELQSQETPHDAKNTDGSHGLPGSIPSSLSLTDLADNFETDHAHPVATTEMLRRRMQELSELGMTFYQQMIEIDVDIEVPAKSFQALDKCVGRVLQSSLKFLALLESLYPLKSPSSSAEATHVTTSDEDLSMSETSVTNDMVMDDCTNGAHSRRRTASRSASTKILTSKSQPTDMTEIFGLLTCYIRILHLHSILYAKFSEYLSENLSREGAHLSPVFPGMEVGGVSLDNFGKFQIKLILQISAHILGEIEMALGLPEKYRISKGGDNYSRGILEGSVSLEFIEMTMKGRSRIDGGMEEDRFSSIRKSLVHLRQLLRGTINT